MNGDPHGDSQQRYAWANRRGCSILGRHCINITTFALDRGLEGAIGIVSVETRNDSDHAPMVTEEILKKFRSVPTVRRATLVNL